MPAAMLAVEMMSATVVPHPPIPFLVKRLG
jgi:hypothetical protein